MQLVPYKADAAYASSMARAIGVDEAEVAKRAAALAD